MSATIAAIVDTAEYPIDAPDSARYRDLVRECRERVAEEAIARLPGFVLPAVVKEVCAEVDELLPHGHHAVGSASPYLRPPDLDLPAEHPVNSASPSALTAIAYDLIPSESPLARLYSAPELARFLADVHGLPTVHPYADPLRPLNVFSYGLGDQNGWHFDGVEFTTMVDLRPAEAGGEFEYVPNIRSADSPNYEEVGRVLQGRSDRVRRAPRAAGDLVVFVGTDTIHRVTRVEGRTSRLVAILGYSREPGVASSPGFRQGRYGRTGGDTHE